VLLAAMNINEESTRTDADGAVHLAVVLGEPLLKTDREGVLYLQALTPWSDQFTKSVTSSLSAI